MSIELGEKLKEGRPLLVAIPLLLLHLTLLSIQIEDPSGMVLFRRWSLAAGGPLFNGTAAVFRAVRHAWSNYVWLIGVRGENARLAERVESLRLREVERGQLETENARLRGLLAF
ncbi:MAG: hypothetical protein FJX57_16150, partial [Alphaproteobacteria bacterium]|nr:hypothetical protein [Alphaproteobacteria bacterium]